MENVYIITMKIANDVSTERYIKGVFTTEDGARLEMLNQFDIAKASFKKKYNNTAYAEDDIVEFIDDKTCAIYNNWVFDEIWFYIEKVETNKKVDILFF